MTGHIVRISGGDLSYDSVDYDSIFAIAFVLFLITMLLNLISRWVVQRFVRSTTVAHKVFKGGNEGPAPVGEFPEGNVYRDS